VISKKIYEQSSIDRLEKEAFTPDILEFIKIDSRLATLLPKDMRLVSNKVISKLKKGSILIRKVRRLSNS